MGSKRVQAALRGSDQISNCLFPHRSEPHSVERKFMTSVPQHSAAQRRAGGGVQACSAGGAGGGERLVAS